MTSRISLALLLTLISFSSILALEPDQVAVIANKNCPESLDIAKFYCAQRHVPPANILELSLPWPTSDKITRTEYNSAVAKPVKDFLTSRAGKIQCLVTTWGIPIKIGPASPEPASSSDIASLQALYDKKIAKLTSIITQLSGMGISQTPVTPKNASLASLYELSGKELNSAIARIEKMPPGKNRSALFIRWLSYCEMINGKNEGVNAAVAYQHLARPLTQAEQAFQLGVVQGQITLITNAQTENWPINQKIKKGFYGSLEEAGGLKNLLAAIDQDLGNLTMKESHSALDSELSMVLYDSYPLSRFLPNELKGRLILTESKTIMVSRLDGPTPRIARELVTRAINAEKTGVKGKAYFDLRVNYGKQNTTWPAIYDKSLTDAASIVRSLTGFETKIESTPALFPSGDCPETALYCGWYSLEKYIPSFKFVPGAVAYHIASFEAVHLRESNTEWCPALLQAGVTATIGAVAEPYLHAFPEPANFFTELLGDNCLVEAYYKTLPFNSWQMILIGDPLYKFKAN